jgi:lincosamide nucleotidyltransferase A/C/D/E
MATSAADVTLVLELLAGAGVDARVSGGWGVDALWGAQTREHRDLDLAVTADRLQVALDTLAGSGFAVTTDWLPVRVELSDGDRHLDLHPLHYADDGSAWQAGLDDTQFHYPADGWTTGRIGAVRVVCLSSAMQRLFHSGYPLREIDRHDLSVLDRVELTRADR